MLTTDGFAARPYILINTIQHYEWGSRGPKAYIPRFIGETPTDDIPYAELWMGAHPSAPSRIVLKGQAVPLNEIIRNHPVETLGKTTAVKFRKQLPFLLKLLSAAEALSIQVHPNREQAVELHQRDPEHYPDDHHKPEIAIALDHLTALVGFREFEQIERILHKYPEIGEFIGRDIVHLVLDRKKGTADPAAILRTLFQTLIHNSISDPQRLLVSIQDLKERIMTYSNRTELETLFLQLRKKYKGPDVGLLMIFFLNLVQLSAGEAVFLGAGVPHAYLKGNLVECMASSDNVVRGGLTPKFQDAATLLDITRYSLKPIEIIRKDPRNAENIYETDAEEFQISRLLLSECTAQSIPTHDRAQILLITKGDGHITWDNKSESGVLPISKGLSIFVPAFAGQIKVTPSVPLTLFRATLP